MVEPRSIDIYWQSGSTTFAKGFLEARVNAAGGGVAGRYDAALTGVDALEGNIANREILGVVSK